MVPVHYVQIRDIKEWNGFTGWLNAVKKLSGWNNPRKLFCAEISLKTLFSH